MGWSRAFNFNMQSDLSINEAMELRKGKDPRAGDLWCCESCYRTKNGSQLLTRKASICKKSGAVLKTAHFARWPGKYDKTGLYCGIKAIADSKRESMDYGHFVSDLEHYISSLVGEEEPYFISSFVKDETEFGPDFQLIHSKMISNEIKYTNLYVIDENKRRKKKFPKSGVEGDTFTLVMKISEYTTEQLTDFEIGGKKKLKVEWDYLLDLVDKIQIKENNKNPVYVKNLKKIEKGKKEVLEKSNLLIDANKFAEKKLRETIESWDPKSSADCFELSNKFHQLSDKLRDNWEDEFSYTRNRISTLITFDLEGNQPFSNPKLQLFIGDNHEWVRKYRRGGYCYLSSNKSYANMTMMNCSEWGYFKIPNHATSRSSYEKLQWDESNWIISLNLDIEPYWKQTWYSEGLSNLENLKYNLWNEENSEEIESADVEIGSLMVKIYELEDELSYLRETASVGRDAWSVYQNLEKVKQKEQEIASIWSKIGELKKAHIPKKNMSTNDL